MSMLDTYKIITEFFSRINFEAHLAKALNFMKRNWLFHVLLIFIFHILKCVFLQDVYTSLLTNCYYTAPLIILFVLTGFVFFLCLFDDQSLQIISLLLSFLSLLQSHTVQGMKVSKSGFCSFFFLLVTNG